jgi:hypothetical protein
MDFPIDAIPIPDHSPKKIPKTPLDNQGSFREGLRGSKFSQVDVLAVDDDASLAGRLVQTVIWDAYGLRRHECGSFRP